MWNAAMVIGMIVVSAVPVGAQVAPPEATGATVESYIFPASRLGAGWMIASDIRRPIADEPPWESAVGRVYAGPRGTRVMVLAFVVEPTRTAIVEAEEAIDRLALDYEYYLFSEAEEIRNVPPITGCESTRRVEGMDDLVYRGGFSSCTIGLEIVLVAITSGGVLNLQGSAAADVVIGVMLIEAR